LLQQNSPEKAKKHVFGSSVGCRGGGCQTLACVLGVLAAALLTLSRQQE